MARIALIAIVAWTLLLLPALCTGGWLLHPCDCESTIGCEHETDCDSDPCEIGMARPDSWSRDAVDDSELTSTLAVHVDAAADQPDNSTVGSPHASSRAFEKALPVPPSDLPRLI